MTNAVNNRPIGRLDAQGRLNQESFTDEAFLGDYQGGVNLIYKGFARAGAATSNDVWQISKLSYDANNNITAIQWPQNSFGAASNDYEFVWDDRATYTYV